MSLTSLLSMSNKFGSYYSYFVVSTGAACSCSSSDWCVDSACSCCVSFMSTTVEIQPQHRPSRLKKPRTESVGTDRLGRVPSRLGEPMTRRKIFRKEYIFGGLCRRSLRALKYDSTSVSPPKDLYKSVH